MNRNAITVFCWLSVGLFKSSFNQGFSQHIPAKGSAVNQLEKRKVGDPLEHLPKNIEVLTQFGERPDISPDNTQIAFMSKIFGDALVMDVKTKTLTCLTCAIPAAAFIRVMHISTGDYLLAGPDHFEDPVSSRQHTPLWYLSKKAGAKPVRIGIDVSEGFALSKSGMKIAFTRHQPHATQKWTQLIVADLISDGETLRVSNEKIILENIDPVSTLEAQDFYDTDTKLTFFCYISNGAFDVKGIDLLSGKITNFTNAPGAFNEPEGIFPDGYTTVEADRQCEWLGGKRGSSNLDIWKLKLNGTGKDFVRLTHFNDYEGGKAANPVVATNNKFMAFQAAKSTDPPGVGHGILIYWFKK